MNLNFEISPKSVLFIGGPTATGKTDLAIKMAHKYNGSVISADSRQVYLEMDIGTAKESTRRPIPESTKSLYKSPINIEGIDHYMIDIIRPDERFTLFDFKSQAYELIKEIQNQNKLPIVAGGTGLYIDALIKNYQLEADKPEDPRLKAKLETRLEEGSESLWEELNKLDPAYAKEIHPNNGYYLVRALETIHLTGKSKPQIAKTARPPFDPIIHIIEMPRDQIYKRVEDRIDKQFEMGIIEETKNLIEKYDENCPALTSLGYHQIAKYLRGEFTLDECKTEFKKLTRHYAKRQITWFKRYL